jgi:hypothetical protein
VSTSTFVVVDHELKDYLDMDAAIALLAQTLPAIAAIDSYWESVDPLESKRESEPWRPAPNHKPDEPVLLGPGALQLYFGPHVVRVGAAARWSGFLTIEPLRNIHLAGFRSLGQAFRGTRMLLLPDAMDEGYAAIYEALSLEECAARLEKKYGPPQPSVTAIPPNAFSAPIPASHLVWFREPL